MSIEQRWSLVVGVILWCERLMSRRRMEEPEREDFRPFLYLYLFEKSASYDPARGSPTTWAMWMFRGALRGWKSAVVEFGPKQIGKAHRVDVLDRDHDAMCLSESSSGEALGNTRGAMPIDPWTEDDLIRLIDLGYSADRIAEVIGQLGERERASLTRSIAGDTLETIGKDLGLCRERIRQLRNLGLQRVRAAMGT